MKNDNKKKGAFGEMLAGKYLENKGYNILNTNYRCQYGEIDIIAGFEGLICFIEVKYRKSLKFGMPREAVTKAKQLKIKETAAFYILENEISDTSFRFDVIEITDENNITQITHIEGAF
jgi:putative endonuclease